MSHPHFSTYGSLGLKPDNLQQLCVTLRNVPYTCSDAAASTPLEGGVLPAGVKIWIEDVPVAVRRTRAVQGYAEGVGMISVQGSFLRRVHA